MSEKRLAKKDNARLVPNSGRGKQKGDAELEDLLIDYKETERSSFSVNKDKFRKHQKDAWRIGKEGVEVIVFGGQDGQALAVIDWYFLKNLMENL